MPAPIANSPAISTANPAPASASQAMAQPSARSNEPPAIIGLTPIFPASRCDVRAKPNSPAESGISDSPAATGVMPSPCGAPSGVWAKML